MDHGPPSRAPRPVREPNPPFRTAILVLGMHRSGTSALTRAISLLGADLPVNLMPAVRDNNEMGFWESLDAYRLNDAILSAAGSSWDDWRRFDPDWLPVGTTMGFKARALALLEQDFEDSNLFVLKDPRLCRLLPFWLEVLQEFRAEPVCILPLRNPVEVAASLGRRDGFSPGKSYLLWLRHVLDAERGTRSMRRAFSSYDGLLGDWRGTVNALSRELDIIWPRPVDSAATEIEAFLQHRHRHHVADDGHLRDQPGVAAWVDETYAALVGLRQKPDPQNLLARLDAVCHEFDHACDTFGVLWRSESAKHVEAQQARTEAETTIERLRAELARQKEQHETIQNQLSQIVLRLHGIQTSPAWQLARPLRAVEQRWSGLVRGGAAMAKVVWWLITLQSRQRLRLRRQVHRLLASGLFDLPWFLDRNADIVLRGADPVLYWLTGGWREGRDPNAVFDSEWYLANNPDVAAAQVSPLVHYLEVGAAEGRAPHPLFDVAWYLEENPEAATLGMTPLTHYLRFGAAQGRDPSPLFETALYLEGQGGGIPAQEALRHFTNSGQEFALGAYRDPDVLLSLQRSYLARTAMQRVWDRRRGDRRFAVYLQCGSGSIHRRWLSGASKPWDLIVNHYDWTYAGQLACDVEFQQVGELPGTKFTSFHTLLQNWPELISSYAYILLLDDDIYLEERDVTALFAVAEDNGLDLAQASLSTDSQGCHEIFFTRGTGGLRFANGVEIMMPVISRRALEEGGHLFGETISGWGLDLALGKLVSERSHGKAAIADQVVARHTKAIDLNNGAYYRMLKREHIYPLLEYRYLQKKYRTDRAFFEV
jgi:hypothetical protein